ncbi:MAG: hypothetical protein ACYSR6_10325 [Planctomycetota bacterium]
MSASSIVTDIVPTWVAQLDGIQHRLRQGLIDKQLANELTSEDVDLLEDFGNIILGIQEQAYWLLTGNDLSYDAKSSGK